MSGESKQCLRDGCKMPARTKGLCGGHYNALLRAQKRAKKKDVNTKHRFE